MKLNLLKLILHEKVYGKKGPTRRRISWLKNLRRCFSTAVNKATVKEYRKEHAPIEEKELFAITVLMDTIYKKIQTNC